MQSMRMVLLIAVVAAGCAQPKVELHVTATETRRDVMRSSGPLLAATGHVFLVVKMIGPPESVTSPQYRYNFGKTVAIDARGQEYRPLESHTNRSERSEQRLFWKKTTVDPIKAELIFHVPEGTVLQGIAVPETIVVVTSPAAAR